VYYLNYYHTLPRKVSNIHKEERPTKQKQNEILNFCFHKISASENRRSFNFIFQKFISQ